MYFKEYQHSISAETVYFIAKMAEPNLALL